MFSDSVCLLEHGDSSLLAVGSRTRGCNQVISLRVGIVGNEQKPEIVLEQDEASSSQEPGLAPRSADFGASLPGFPSFSPVT